jgi:hypothetical protein
MYNLILIILIFITLYFLYKKKCDCDQYYYLDEGFNNTDVTKPKSNVGLITFMRKPIDLKIWLDHHRNLGVAKFFIRVEDTPELEPYLKNQKDVWLEMSESDKTGNNYQTLFDRQVVFIDKILDIAKSHNIDFVFNVDVDELLHGSLNFLDDLDENNKCLIIENVEAVYSENEESCFSTNKFLRCAKTDKCRAYANGKSGARVTEGVSAGGVHGFLYNKKYQGPNIYQVPYETLKILHFDSCSIGSWFEKFYHLSKNKKDNIPFPYYKDSIKALEEAYQIYKKYTMDYVNGVSQDILFIRE